MKKPGMTALLFVLGFISIRSGLAAQEFSFQYGSIPFGESEDFIISRVRGAEIERKSAPTAQFLSSDVIIEEEGANPVFTFFNGGIRKTVAWGDAYVDLYEEHVKRIDIRLPGEAKSDLYFYDDRLFLLHKAVRLEERYKEAFDNLIPALNGRIGGEPVTDDTRFRGFTYELYAKYAFWYLEDVTIFVLVREKNFQSKVSTAEFVYVDTELWEEYKRRIQNESANNEDLLRNF